MTFNYPHLSGPNYKPDVLSATDGAIIFRSQDDNVRTVAYNNGTYRVITNSYIFGAMQDTDTTSTKQKLMKQYLNFLQDAFSHIDFVRPDQVPAGSTLFPCYPNPFNPVTTISYLLSQSGDVEITIYNSAGKKVKELLFRNQTLGNHKIEWDGTDLRGNLLPSGLYLIMVKSNYYSKMQKVSFIR